MKTVFKKTAAVLVAALLLVALMPVSALAATLSYSCNGIPGKIVVNYDGTKGSVSRNNNGDQSPNDLSKNETWEFTANPNTGYAVNWTYTQRNLIITVSGNTLTVECKDNGHSVELTATANFVPATYTVTFASGSHGSLSGQTVYGGLHIGDAFPAAPTVNADAGWEFTGWDPSLPGTVQGTQTYTAQYSQITYTVTFAAGSHGSLSGQTVYGGLQTGDDFPAAPTVNADAGWEFTGWNPSLPDKVQGTQTYTAQYSRITHKITTSVTNGTIDPVDPTVNHGEDQEFNYSPDPHYILESVVVDGTDVTSGHESAYTFSNVTSAHSITVTYVKETHTVTFKDYNGAVLKTQTVEYGSGATAPPDPDNKPGYHFTGWDKDFSSVTEDIVVTAQYAEVINYQITYVLNGGTNNPGNPATYTVEDSVTLLDPTRPGYTFTGWTPSGSIAAGTTGDLEFTANWEVVNYQITYVLNGGTNNPGNPATYTVEDSVTLLDPVREGYNFTGWTPSGSIAAGTTGNLEFTANWAIKTYSVRFFRANGITQIGTTQTVSWGGAAALETAPAIAGRTFAGWTLNGDDASVTTSLSNVKENIDAVASYTINVYTVTFRDYDGTLLGTDRVRYGEDATPPADPTREGYTFIGWSDSIDGITGNITVYAMFRINTYTVRFVDFDGTVLKTQTVDWNTGATAPADPVREGYTFTGWDVPFTNVKSDLTVTAQYSANPVVSPSEAPSPAASPAATITPEPVPATGGGTSWLWWLLIIPGGLLIWLIILLARRRKKEEEPVS